jgi:hypothetical protein
VRIVMGGDGFQFSSRDLIVMFAPK